MAPKQSLRHHAKPYEDKVRSIFEKATFVTNMGIELKALGEGWCETTLEVTPQHLQQNKFIHAGVQATMADHTAGGAAGTQLKDNQTILTVAFQINFLRPAIGNCLRCHSVVLKPGKTLCVVESQVYAQSEQVEKLVSKATVTLAVVIADSYTLPIIR